MTIEIHQPEIEALIQQRLQSGAFHDVEEVLLHALRRLVRSRGIAGRRWGVVGGGGMPQ